MKPLRPTLVLFGLALTTSAYADVIEVGACASDGQCALGRCLPLGTCNR